MSILSYIYPETLFRSGSRWNRSIVVQETNGIRELYVDNVMQSGPWYRNMWRKVLTEMHLDTLGSNFSVLLLGMGGGDVIRVIRRISSYARITIVEIDPEIIRLAEKFFGIYPDPYTTVVNNDAAYYLYNSKNQEFDTVIVDLYQGDRVPDFVSKVSFIRRIRKKMKKSSSVIFNYASGSFSQRRYSEFEALLKSIFPVVERIIVKGHTFFKAQN